MDDRDGIILDDEGDGQILDNELTFPQHQQQHQRRSLSALGSTYSEPHAPLPLAMRSIPRLFRFDNAKPEATGLAIDMYARGTILMSSLFMGPALLSLARNAAQEQCNDCGDDARIYGMKPSSLLSNIAIASGLFGAFILPLFGAIVDHTPYRRRVGIWSAVGLAAIKGVETIISARTWLFVALLQTISGALYFVHATATYAYTSDLTDNHTEQTKYNVYYFVVLYVSTLVFLTQVLIVAFAIHTDDVGTAKISQVIACLTSSICFAISWKWLFRERPALSAVPEGNTLLVAGFQKIAASSAMIANEFPGLKWFMGAVISSESATAALITIATTYMSHFLEMDATEIGVVFVLVLAMGIPGSKLGEMLGLRYNPLTSAKICVVFFIVSTTAAAMILTSSQDKHLTPVFGVLWGLGLGWLHPMHSTIFITISPRGQESELMAIYLFCGQVFSWVPPLLFTILNEAGVRMSVGLGSLNIFFMAGLIFLYLMGDYSAALEQARSKGAAMAPVDESVIDHCSELSLPPIS
jgi:MFS-type transporter involved in bile tolerance (Atg22 family)